MWLRQRIPIAPMQARHCNRCLSLIRSHGDAPGAVAPRACARGLKCDQQPALRLHTILPPSDRSVGPVCCHCHHAHALLVLGREKPEARGAIQAGGEKEAVIDKGDLPNRRASAQRSLELARTSIPNLDASVV